MLDLDTLVLAPSFATWGETNRGNATPVYTPLVSQPDGAAFTIEGIFRIPAENVLGIGDAPGSTTRAPEIDFRVSQFPSGVTASQGDQVVVRGVTYLIADARPDGDGLVTCKLSEA